jgi:hypothetical protein
MTVHLGAATADGHDDGESMWSSMGDGTADLGMARESLGAQNSPTAASVALVDRDVVAACSLGSTLRLEPGPDGVLRVAGNVVPCDGHPAASALTICPDGTGPVMALARERRRADDPWGPWTATGEVWCPSTGTVTPEAVAAEFARLPLPAPALTMQPDRGWVLVNMRTIVYTDPAPAVFDLTLLGVPVHLTATPARYAWTWDDGATSATTSPGHPYPDDDVSHVYELLGTYRITLTTTWTATYTLGTDPTAHTVPGTATTSATGPDFVVRELRAHLVGETCDEDPDAPGC